MEDGGRPAFGTLLRHYRLEAGLSQEALAERARMSAETIGALERGARRSPYRETVALLTSALQLGEKDRGLLESAAHPQRPRERTRQAPLRMVEPRSHNLPSELSSLIGRGEVVADVGALVGAHRIVTLVGGAGVGKTRIALRVAENLLCAFSAGACLAELGPIDQPSLVSHAIAHALTIDASPGGSCIDSVIAFLGRKRLLLVLDCCEHLMAVAREATVAILRGCPNVKILATSREPLSVTGERTYRVPTLADSDAVRLFVDRSQAIDPAFEPDAENAQAIAEICRRLDGLPLAIELAAARSGTLSPRRLVQMLDQPFRVLCGGDRAAPPRSQTMHAAIEWSFALLSEPERVLARRLGVFTDGWTLEAAEAVCSDAPLAVDQILELLTCLVHKSLVSVDLANGARPYRYLEFTRAFAVERLAECNEHDAIALNHARWSQE